MAEAWKWMIKIYTGNHCKTLNGSLLKAQGILSAEQKKQFFSWILWLTKHRIWIILILWQVCLALLLGHQCWRWLCWIFKDHLIYSISQGLGKHFKCEKKSLKGVDALVSQLYILPGLFGPSHLFIGGYFKAIYFCRTQLALSKCIVCCKGERRR